MTPPSARIPVPDQDYKDQFFISDQLQLLLPTSPHQASGLSCCNCASAKSLSDGCLELLTNSPLDMPGTGSSSSELTWRGIWESIWGNHHRGSYHVERCVP